MKTFVVEQGSPEWVKLRLGIPTASEFKRILTPAGKLSKDKTSRAYAFKLVAEKLLNRSLDDMPHVEWVERGKLLEPAAVKLYEFDQETKTAVVGFITTDDGRIGASPDRLVGESGMVEVKCPAPQTHVGYMLEGFDPDYRPQVQGQLYVAEREWSDWFSYSDEMPSVTIRTARDEPYIKALRDALDQFNDLKDEMLERCRASGMFESSPCIVTPAEAAYDGTQGGKYVTILDPFGPGMPDEAPWVSG